MLKLCVCFSTLIAATRSYSRSTGALHTPDTFGAAGEGWVHLFLCTSPTHSASIFRWRFFSSLFSTHASPCWLLFRKFLGFFCSSTSRLLSGFFFFSFVFFVLTLCSRMSKLFHWNRMFPPVQLPVDNHAVSFTDASVLFFFLWALSCLCRDMESFSSVSCWSFFLPQWHLQCHLTSHHVNLHHFFHGKNALWNCLYVTVVDEWDQH